MLTRRDIIIKWSSYGVAAMLLLFLNALTLRQFEILGVRAFLPPLILAVVASLEDTRPAVLFGLAFGVCCDLAVSAPLPCLYTLAFTGAALCVSLMAKSVLQPGLFCSLAATLLTFVFVDALSMLALFLRSRAELMPMLSLALREAGVSCLLLAVCHPALTALHRKFTL